MIKKGAVVLLIGLPASGKSTLADNLIKYLSCIQIKPYLIKFDALISIDQQIELVNQTQKWKKTRKNFFQAFETFLDLILDLPSPSPNDNVNYLLSKILDSNLINQVSENFLVMVEDNFYYRSMRQPFFQATKSRSIGFGIVMIKTSLNECLKRNNLRGKNYIPDQIIIKMNQFFEEPNESNSENIKSIIINHGLNDMNLIVHFIRELIQNSFKNVSLDCLQKQKHQGINNQNLIHQFDNLLRKVVSQLMKSKKVKYDGQRLSLIKKKIINEFKNNPNLIPVWLSQELFKGCKESEKALQFGLILIKNQMIKN